MLQAKAHAKINWDLRILGRRADQFHELDSVFVNLALHDDMRFELVPNSDSLTLTCSDPTLPVDGSNLVIKAANLLASEARSELPADLGAKIHLVKHIPMGGGMGGGSSDAACTLHALNALWNLNWPVSRLSEIAAKVGSDVAYFLHGGWCLCRGRGEVVQRLPGSTQWPAVKILMVLPPLHVSTPAVYRALNFPLWDGGEGRNAQSAAAQVAKDLIDSTDSTLNLRNDLSDAARRVEPRLLQIQAVLDEFFPGRWLMSGSGASHFAVPNSALSTEKRVKFSEELNRAVPGTRVVETGCLSSVKILEPI